LTTIWPLARLLLSLFDAVPVPLNVGLRPAQTAMEESFGKLMRTVRRGSRDIPRPSCAAV